MAYKISVLKYLEKYNDGLDALAKEIIAEGTRKGNFNSMEEDLLLDLGLIELSDRDEDKGSNKSEGMISGVKEKDEEFEESKSDVLGVFDFQENGKEVSGRRREFWSLINEVQKEIKSTYKGSVGKMNLILPSRFIKLVSLSVSYISGEDENFSNSEEFRSFTINYEGRINGSELSIYSMEKNDFIYIELVGTKKYAVIKIK